jgi:hypothetical protein
MKRFAAHAISFLFHPVILALFAPVLIIRSTTTNIIYCLEWMAFSSVFFVGIFLVLYAVRRDRLFSDFDFYHKESRLIFYAVCLFFSIAYFVTAFVIKGIFFPLSIVSLGIIVGLVLIDFINFYIKVSVHTAIASAFVITVGFLYGFLPFLLVVWLPFIVAWSRQVLKQHTRQEVYIGGIFGTFMTLLIFILAKVIL